MNIIPNRLSQWCKEIGGLYVYIVSTDGTCQIRSIEVDRKQGLGSSHYLPANSRTTKEELVSFAASLPGKEEEARIKPTAEEIAQVAIEQATANLQNAKEDWEAAEEVEREARENYACALKAFHAVHAVVPNVG